MKGRTTVEISEDSNFLLDRLFDLSNEKSTNSSSGGLNPTSKTNIPMKDRKLPPSFFMPPLDDEPIFAHYKSNSSPACVCQPVDTIQVNNNNLVKNSQYQSYNNSLVNKSEKDFRLNSTQFKKLRFEICELNSKYDIAIDSKNQVFFLNHESEETSWYDPRIPEEFQSCGMTLEKLEEVHKAYSEKLQAEQIYFKGMEKSVSSPPVASASPSSLAKSSSNSSSSIFPTFQDLYNSPMTQKEIFIGQQNQLHARSFSHPENSSLLSSAGATCTQSLKASNMHCSSTGNLISPTSDLASKIKSPIHQHCYSKCCDPVTSSPLVVISPPPSTPTLEQHHSQKVDFYSLNKRHVQAHDFPHQKTQSNHQPLILNPLMYNRPVPYCESNRNDNFLKNNFLLMDSSSVSMTSDAQSFNYAHGTNSKPIEFCRPQISSYPIQQQSHSPTPSASIFSQRPDIRYGPQQQQQLQQLLDPMQPTQNTQNMHLSRPNKLDVHYQYRSANYNRSLNLPSYNKFNNNNSNSNNSFNFDKSLDSGIHSINSMQQSNHSQYHLQNHDLSYPSDYNISEALDQNIGLSDYLQDKDELEELPDLSDLDFDSLSMVIGPQHGTIGGNHIGYYSLDPTPVANIQTDNWG